MSFAPPLDWAPVDQVIEQLAQYDAVAVTSPRAAAAFVERMSTLGYSAPPAGPEIWASGAATKSALGKALGPVRAAAERETGTKGAGAALAAAMLAAGVGGPVLFPCGELRWDELPARLRADGVEVDEVVCYRPVLAPEEDARAAAERAGILLVASPSIAQLLARACPPGVRPPLLAVGPTTAAAAQAAGWPPAAVAARPNVQALVAGVRGLLARRGSA